MDHDSIRTLNFITTFLSRNFVTSRHINMYIYVVGPAASYLRCISGKRMPYNSHLKKKKKSETNSDL